MEAHQSVRSHQFGAGQLHPLENLDQLSSRRTHCLATRSQCTWPLDSPAEPMRVNLAAKENTYLVAAKNLNTLRGHLLELL